MLKCIRCGEDKILDISGKTSDCFSFALPDGSNSGSTYVPGEIGIGRGDYVEFKYCLNCGQIQDKFPKELPVIDNDAS
jgi:hypothetical protein